MVYLFNIQPVILTFISGALVAFTMLIPAIGTLGAVVIGGMSTYGVNCSE